jgi:hypothetical protein
VRASPPFGSAADIAWDKRCRCSCRLFSETSVEGVQKGLRDARQCMRVGIVHSAAVIAFSEISSDWILRTIEWLYLCRILSEYYSEALQFLHARSNVRVQQALAPCANYCSLNVTWAVNRLNSFMKQFTSARHVVGIPLPAWMTWHWDLQVSLRVPAAICSRG